MKVKDVIKKMEADGWYYIGTTGDHHKYKKEGRRATAAVAGKPSDEVSPGVLAQIRRITGIDFR